MTLPSGGIVLLARRKTEQIIRAGEKTASDAVRKGSAAWAIEYEALIAARAQGARAVAVIVRETGDLYMTQIERFFDAEQAKTLSWANGPQRALALDSFVRRIQSVPV